MSLGAPPAGDGREREVRWDFPIPDCLPGNFLRDGRRKLRKKGERRAVLEIRTRRRMKGVIMRFANAQNGG